jgi:carbon-monoxide dehydrogenase large subunit
MIAGKFPTFSNGRPMNAPLAADNLDLMKFGVGQPVPRKEDPTLLKGQGRYSDDVNLDGQVYAVMVRSQVAHGVLKGIDADEARKMPGVLGIWTGKPISTTRATARSRP